MKILINLLMILVLLVAPSGCMFERFDDSDSILSTDPTVDAQTTEKVTSYLLTKVPGIRQEKGQLAAGGEKIKLIVRLENAPDPGHPKADPDARYHTDYYWLYVGYHNRDRIVKYYRYLVHKEVHEILLYSEEKDAFEKV